MDASALDKSISILEKTISSLGASADSWEVWLWVSTIAVVVGVAAELYFVIREHTSEQEAWRRASIRSPQKPSAWLFRLKLLSVALVVLGIAGEFMVGVVSANRNSALRNMNRKLVALIRQKAGNAERDAGEANERASANEKEAETLRQQNLVLQADVLKLRTALTWTRLTREQRLIIARTVRPFHFADTVHVNIMGSAPSVTDFANDLAAALAQGGMKTELVGLVRNGAAPVLRVIPAFKITGPTSAIPLMKALISGLRRLGVFDDVLPPLIATADDRGGRIPDIDVQISNKGNP